MPNALALTKGILDYAAKNRLPFHTPGHKGGKGLAPVLSGEDMYRLDLTELPELDDLHQARGIIAEAQANCARWLGAKATFFLVNGASVGIQAAFMAVLKPGDCILVPRNAHKSVSAALVLSGARPVYYSPVVHPDFGLPLGQNPEAILDKLANEQIKGVVALYPTYFGTVWPLDQVRRQWDGLLIVDEAHGAHFPFSGSLPATSLALGADLVIHGSHKTLAALTQGAMLHLGSSKHVGEAQIRQALDLLQTTSPSYPIMASLECAVWQEMEYAPVRWDLLSQRALNLKESLAKKGFRVLQDKDAGDYGIQAVDPTKILIRVSDGQAIVKELAEKYSIQAELWDEHNILFLMGAGDSEDSIARLEQALLNISPFYTDGPLDQRLPEMPPQALTPREAYFSPKEFVPLKDAVGRVCGETLSPYPPGIPVVVAGEIITRELIEYIQRSLLRGLHWQGCSDPSLNKILVIKESPDGRSVNYL